MGKSFSKTGWVVSLLFVALYLVCVAWGLFVIKDPALVTFHSQSLAITFPGFTWLTTGSFFLGLVLSFVYGWIAAGIYVGICNLLCGNHGDHGDHGDHKDGGCCH